MATKRPAQTEEKAVQTARTPETETTYIPDVDISENGELIRLMVDMPGADQNAVDVTVENNVLTIEGRAVTEPLADYELIGQEYGVGRYRRDFTLSNAVDTEGIKARVRNGVLELSIPKRDEEKTRKIAIEC